MTNITTLDILKALPFEEQFKEKVAEKFDSLTPDQRYAVEDIIWDSYEIFYNLTLEENLALAHERVEEGLEQLDDKFFERAQIQTKKQIMSNLQETIATEDLSDAREQLQEIIEQSH